MKRILLTLLTIFYLGTSSGAEVHLHYCMGELVNVGLTESKQANCELCGMTKHEGTKNSCCKDESKQAKVDQSKKISQFTYQFKVLPVFVPSIFKSEAYDSVLSGQQIKAVFHDVPPERLSIPAFIRNCTYRI